MTRDQLLQRFRHSESIQKLGTFGEVLYLLINLCKIQLELEDLRNF